MKKYKNLDNFKIGDLIFDKQYLDYGIVVSIQKMKYDVFWFHSDYHKANQFTGSHSTFIKHSSFAKVSK
ncbi:MAG: hypothetical protein Q8P81_03590 [Nanoarchaeota archaeon]|nr:hypothetical protein [Nanoarchaeota archaeon]